MLQKQTITQSWGIGLNAYQTSFLRGTLGEEHELVLFSPGELRHTPVNDSTVQPHVLWISSACGNALERLPDRMLQYVAASPKVLLLEPGYSLADFESACDHGFTDTLRPPLSRERVAEIMRRSLETRTMHYDMECMTREILLERELLERKNDILSFLVGFLANATESLDLTYLLQTAYMSLGQLLPVRAMHAVFWDRDGDGSPVISLHICAPENSTAHEIWRGELLKHARSVVGPDCAATEINTLSLRGQSEQWSLLPPEENNLLTLPLICGNENLGMLVLVTSMQRHLGRDQVMALDSAIRHFALSIKNAKRFRKLQMYADYDALTKVHSRRHFESRLEEEMERLTRYGEPLSMIMLDIDLFKQVNDTRGHHVGDIVLREVASILAQSIRATDYCARYGGEEFAILLPHTEHKKAAVLAERMRKQVAAHTFLVAGGAPLNITISLGIASLTGDSLKNKQALICGADSALYAAKKNGRNRIVVAPQAKSERDTQRNVG